MADLSAVGRVLVGVGLVLVAVGLVLLVAPRASFLQQLGRLPGDFVIRRGDATIYVPIVTSIVVSLVLSLVLAIVFRR